MGLSGEKRRPSSCSNTFVTKFQRPGSPHDVLLVRAKLGSYGLTFTESPELGDDIQKLLLIITFIIGIRILSSIRPYLIWYIRIPSSSFSVWCLSDQKPCGVLLWISTKSFQVSIVSSQILEAALTEHFD